MNRPHTSSGPDFILSSLAYDMLWEHLGLDEQHLMLPVESHGETLEQRRMLKAQCWEQLQRDELVQGPEVAPELAAALQTLARPSVELYATLESPGQPTIRTVGAGSDTGCYLAVRHADTLRIGRSAHERFTSEFVELLPPVGAATGRSVSVPTEALHTETGLSAGQVEERLTRSGISASEARVFSAAIRGPKSCVGKIAAASRDYANVRAAAEWIVTFLDTERGRYTAVSKPSGDGCWMTVAPADPQRLRTAVEEMLATVAPEDAHTRTV